MKRWLRSMLWILEGLIVLGVVYFEPTYCVRGTVWGEAFFDGKPTSYWRGERVRWDFEVHRERPTGWCASEPRIRYVAYSRNPTWFENAQAGFREQPDDRSHEWLATAFRGPRILRAGDESAPVLRALLNDPSPKIRQFAQIGLGLKSEFPDDE